MPEPVSFWMMKLYSKEAPGQGFLVEVGKFRLRSFIHEKCKRLAKQVFIIGFHLVQSIGHFQQKVG